MKPEVLTPRIAAALSGIVLVLGASACGTVESSSRMPAAGAEQTSTDSESDAESEASAEKTVRAFFSVRSSAEDPYSTKIDAQARYLTERSVHPSAAYEQSMGDGPVGIDEEEVTVELSAPRPEGDSILFDFQTATTGVSYPMTDGVLEMDQAQEQRSHWDGTATLVERGGEWLISGLTMDSFGGAVDDEEPDDATG